MLDSSSSDAFILGTLLLIAAIVGRKLGISGKTPRVLVGLFGTGLAIWSLFSAHAARNEAALSKLQAPPESRPLAAPARPDTAANTDSLPERPSLEQRATISFSACTIPLEPGEDPDGKIASRGELLTQKTAVVQYDADVTRYIECIVDKKERLKAEYAGIAGSAELDELDERARTLRNAAFEQVTARVEKFNQQLRAYKAARSSKTP